MPEATFAGRGAKIAPWPPTSYSSEISEVGSDLFESEDLTNKIYEGFISLLASGWTTNKITRSLDDIYHGYKSGFYLPAIRRMVLRGQVDLINDDISEYSGLISFDSDGMLLSSTRKCALPRGVVSPVRGQPLATSLWTSNRKSEERRNLNRGGVGGESLHVDTLYSILKSDGIVVPAFKQGDPLAYGSLIVQITTITINANADAKHLWRIKTSENLAGTIDTPIVIGCDGEQVKSLFYARSLPITASGRKRPILHWVAAHKRRMKEGIEIDVQKHLRGITSFEMDSLPFEIVNPPKLYRVK